MTKFTILFIFFLAVGLRFYQLGSNPPSLDWDETSIGYNAYSILKTGADEYGNKFPLSIRSFDDYKPALYTYLTVPSVAFFGLNEFSVRFPSAIIGILTVVIIYFLVKELLDIWDEKTKQTIAIISTLFVAISPWLLQFSRAAFEGTIGLFFFSIGALFFLKGIKRSGFFVLSSISFVLSMYSYHSFRLLIPIFTVLIAIIFSKELLKNKQTLFFSLILMTMFSLPIFSSLFAHEGAGARLSMVTLFESPHVTDSSAKQLEFDKRNNDYLGSLFHNRRIAYSLAIVKGYLDHFNPDFLFLHGDGGRQHHAVDMGMLYFWDLPFLLVGVYLLLNKFNKRILLLFIWFLIAPLPSAITTGTPHPVRAIAMSLPMHVFSAVGVYFIYLTISQRVKKTWHKYALIVVILIVLSGNIMYYLHQYYVHTPIEYGDFWQYGNKQAILEVKQYENTSNKIVISYAYDQPYIYYLFYNKIDPSWYQKNWDYNRNGQIDRFERIIGKYEFRNINFAKDKYLQKTILVGTPDEIPQNSPTVKQIFFPDGRIGYRIVQL